MSALYLLTIDVGGAIPIRQWLWKVPIHRRALVETELDCMLGDRVIEPTKGQWVSPLLLVKRSRFQFRVMPFGALKCALHLRAADGWGPGRTLAEGCLMHLDDIMTYGLTFGECKECLRSVLQRQGDADLKVKPSKSQLFWWEAAFLGHMESGQGIATDPEKPQMVRRWPTPTCVEIVWSFHGFCSYYRSFVPGFATVCHPITLEEPGGTKDLRYRCFSSGGGSSPQPEGHGGEGEGTGVCQSGPQQARGMST